MREPAFQLLPRPPRVELAGRRLLVLGLGDSGLSVVRWAERLGASVRVADTRQAPPRARDFTGELRLGKFTPSLLDGIDLLCISPGLPLADPLVEAALARSIPIVGDIELFAWKNDAPVVAISGTNGKTTVTALTGHLLKSAGMDCEVAGNIAPPVLQAALERKTPPQAWVLELSSYQLETTWSLNAQAATVLNVSEDHLDRYAGMPEYAAAKARIFQGDGVQILNRDDPVTLRMALPGRRIVTFGLEAPRSAHDFGIANGRLVEGESPIVEAKALPIHGAHNVANALAACALARALGVPRERLQAGLRSFRGLPHRLELLATRDGVQWYDDSKGTNVGATIAALRGLGRKAVLILGGEGKGQDFSPLRPVVEQAAVCVLLIGRDAPLIEAALSGLPTERCATLEDAVRRAARVARAGQAVLLSPACASFDMFRDYKHRGEVFAAAVKALPASGGPSA
ncbi:MAG TPA: UDP-N-acetylmuramoyl-L-alanine--D-glutamate ligase [Burkholderiales bacterium]